MKHLSLLLLSFLLAACAASVEVPTPSATATNTPPPTATRAPTAMPSPTSPFQIPETLSLRQFLLDAPLNDLESVPHWSPGGDYIAYGNHYNCGVDNNGWIVFQECHGPDIFLASADGSFQARITAFQPSELRIVRLLGWSPDGKLFAFLYEINKETPWRVAAIDVQAGLVRPQKISDTIPLVEPMPSESVTGFSWAPDGTMVAYSTGTHPLDDYTFCDGGPSRLVIASSEGRAVWEMTTQSANDGGPCYGEGYIAEPKWSPGGTWIAFYSDINAPEASVLNVETREITVLPGQSYGFFWSHLDNWLFDERDSNESDGSQVVVDLATMTSYRLPTIIINGSMSPDGKWIVVVMSRACYGL